MKPIQNECTPSGIPSGTAQHKALHLPFQLALNALGSFLISCPVSLCQLHATCQLAVFSLFDSADMPHTNQHRGQCIPISTLDAAYASIVAITAVIVMATKQQATYGHADASGVPAEALDVSFQVECGQQPQQRFSSHTPQAWPEAFGVGTTLHSCDKRPNEAARGIDYKGSKTFLFLPTSALQVILDAHRLECSRNFSHEWRQAFCTEKVASSSDQAEMQALVV
ncbi:MAG: hypothetical protein FRX49_13802 [Trebouxia sp. A1-2]|nr:MAG: hypothetical protein FRX49_13802 [Trebouxia sp. A1-2]